MVQIWSLVQALIDSSEKEFFLEETTLDTSVCIVLKK